MADDKPAPTEEQVKAHNEAEDAKWNGDFKDEELNIPYRRQAADDTVDDKTGKDDDKADDDIEVPDTNEYTAPAPVVTVQDPGDYKPADYSFEVTLKDGKTVKVSTTEEAEKLADDPDNFETPKQLMDFINKQNKMRTSLDRDQEKWAAQKKTFTEQLATETQRRETVDTYVGEFSYLVGKGLMPKIDKQYLDADWSDPEIAKQPGVKEQLALLDYMVKENAVREKAHVKPITSVVDAFNAWQMDEGHQKAIAKAKEAEDASRAAGETRRANSARVAGVSPAQQGTYVPKGIAVGNPNVLKRGAAAWD